MIKYLEIKNKHKEKEKSVSLEKMVLESPDMQNSLKIIENKETKLEVYTNFLVLGKQMALEHKDKLNKGIKLGNSISYAVGNEPMEIDVSMVSTGSLVEYVKEFNKKVSALDEKIEASTLKVEKNFQSQKEIFKDQQRIIDMGDKTVSLSSHKFILYGILGGALVGSVAAGMLFTFKGVATVAGVTSGGVGGVAAGGATGVLLKDKIEKWGDSGNTMREFSIFNYKTSGPSLKTEVLKSLKSVISKFVSKKDKNLEE